MCSPQKSDENFLIFKFYESKQMSLTQDLRWSLDQSIALQVQHQTDLLHCTMNCFPQWAHLQNMAVGDLAFYYTLYLWYTPIRLLIHIHGVSFIFSMFYIHFLNDSQGKTKETALWWVKSWVDLPPPPKKRKKSKIKVGRYFGVGQVTANSLFVLPFF